MAKHRPHSVEFKRQVVQEYLAGETIYGLERRHDICRNLVRIWIKKFEAGQFDEDVVAVDLFQQYEARIAALERLVGKQALEIEFLKGAQNSSSRPRSGPTSVIVGPPLVSIAKGCRLMGLARATYYAAPMAARTIRQSWKPCRQSATNSKPTAGAGSARRSFTSA